jgi:hypothetical protein
LKKKLLEKVYLLIVMNKLYILDFLISSVLAGVNIKYTKTIDYKILVAIIWSIFIISSILLNNSLPIYFISSIIIGFSILAIYILLKIPINNDIQIVFWVLYLISALVLTFIVASKKMFFSNVYNEPLMGLKGDDGKLGSKGESYYLKTYPEKCYSELILTVEDYLVQNMKINDIDYDPYEYQLKNLYFKQLFKRISLSREFNDYVFLGNITKEYTCGTGTRGAGSGSDDANICKYTGKTLSSENGRTYGDTTEPCVTDRVDDDYQKTKQNVSAEVRYNTMMIELKSMVIKWCKYILFNNDNEDDDLKEKLGYDKTADITKLIPSFAEDTSTATAKINNNLREDMRHNNKTGRKFLDDYFLTDKYFDEYLIKENNKRDKQQTYSPFTKIKDTTITIGDNNQNPFNWGKSSK